MLLHQLIAWIDQDRPDRKQVLDTLCNEITAGPVLQGLTVVSARTCLMIWSGSLPSVSSRSVASCISPVAGMTFSRALYPNRSVLSGPSYEAVELIVGQHISALAISHCQI
jgi:hypothetical protein